MVTRVHDARASDERGAEGWHHHDEGPPDLTLRIQDVEFRGEVERKIEETSEGDWVGLVLTFTLRRRVPTTAMT